MAIKRNNYNFLSSSTRTPSFVEKQSNIQSKLLLFFLTGENIFFSIFTTVNVTKFKLSYRNFVIYISALQQDLITLILYQICFKILSPISWLYTFYIDCMYVSHDCLNCLRISIIMVFRETK